MEDYPSRFVWAEIQKKVGPDMAHLSSVLRILILNKREYAEDHPRLGSFPSTGDS